MHFLISTQTRVDPTEPDSIDVLQLAIRTGFAMEANWRELKTLSKSV